jgi:hypothetical protein
MSFAPAMLAALRSQSPKFNLEDLAFPQQRDFISDPARLKTLFCTRRAAKSFTAGLYLIHEALTHPGCNCLFVGLTRLSARGIIWKDILKEINQRLTLGIHFNETDLSATFPNGSVIHVTGADSDEDEMNKLLGKKYRLVTIDEASMYTIDMNQLVYGILKPATADQRGTICLLGTSSNITRGLFYDITNKREPGWSLHTWTAFDNPHVQAQWQEELDDIQTNRPLFMKTALFRQWYLNEWVVDEDAKVYKFDPLLNTTHALPLMDTPYRYVLGVDLGHSPDPTAFVIGCFHETIKTLFIVHAEKHLKLDITAVAERIFELNKRFNFDVRVVDNANKQAVAELNNRHQTQLIAADKTGKVDFINLMNTDFIQGNIKCLPSTLELQQEYQSLVWVTDNGKVVEPRKEHASLPNHLTDAALYLWRHCYQYLWAPKAYEPAFDSQERWEPEHLKRLEEQVKQQQNPFALDLSYEPELFDFSNDDVI